MRYLFLVFALFLVSFSLPASGEQFSLVDVDWACGHCEDPGLRILDVRASFADYLAGHVPNAVHFPESSLRGPHNGMPVQFLSLSLMQQLLLRAGVRDDERILIYSDGESILGATMVAYALERLGHPDVMLLNGGWSEFKKAGRAVQTFPIYKPGMLTTKDNRQIRADLADVKAAIGNPEVVLIDARPNGAYTGETKMWSRDGHIPGAINVDWHELMDPDNPHKFKTKAQLAAVYEARNLKKSDNIIVYCSTGREATLEYAVLKHILGYPNVRLYEGSWIEYSSDPANKVETGNPVPSTVASSGE